ncbi:hypothetical protein BOX15_Mlig016077g1, partial [Macrostomum lignano]
SDGLPMAHSAAASGSKDHEFATADSSSVSNEMTAKLNASLYSWSQAELAVVADVLDNWHLASARAIWLRLLRRVPGTDKKPRDVETLLERIARYSNLTQSADTSCAGSATDDNPTSMDAFLCMLDDLVPGGLDFSTELADVLIESASTASGQLAEAYLFLASLLDGRPATGLDSVSPAVCKRLLGMLTDLLPLAKSATEQRDCLYRLLGLAHTSASLPRATVFRDRLQSLLRMPLSSKASTAARSDDVADEDAVDDSWLRSRCALLADYAEYSVNPLNLSDQLLASFPSNDAEPKEFNIDAEDAPTTSSSSFMKRYMTSRADLTKELLLRGLCDSESDEEQPFRRVAYAAVASARPDGARPRKIQSDVPAAAVAAKKSTQKRKTVKKRAGRPSKKAQSMKESRSPSPTKKQTGRKRLRLATTKSVATAASSRGNKRRKTLLSETSQSASSTYDSSIEELLAAGQQDDDAAVEQAYSNEEEPGVQPSIDAKQARAPGGELQADSSKRPSQTPKSVATAGSSRSNKRRRTLPSETSQSGSSIDASSIEELLVAGQPDDDAAVEQAANEEKSGAQPSTKAKQVCAIKEGMLQADSFKRPSQTPKSVATSGSIRSNKRRRTLLAGNKSQSVSSIATVNSLAAVQPDDGAAVEQAANEEEPGVQPPIKAKKACAPGEGELQADLTNQPSQTLPPNEPSSVEISAEEQQSTKPTVERVVVEIVGVVEPPLDQFVILENSFNKSANPVDAATSSTDQPSHFLSSSAQTQQVISAESVAQTPPASKSISKTKPTHGKENSVSGGSGALCTETVMVDPFKVNLNKFIPHRVARPPVFERPKANISLPNLPPPPSQQSASVSSQPAVETSTATSVVYLGQKQLTKVPLARRGRARTYRNSSSVPEPELTSARDLVQAGYAKRVGPKLSVPISSYVKSVVTTDSTRTAANAAPGTAAAAPGTAIPGPRTATAAPGTAIPGPRTATAAPMTPTAASGTATAAPGARSG